MSADLPEPLTPPECDLRAFATMSIDIVRLFGSTFHAHANDAEWRAGVILWLKSWHQMPAASVPADDIELARLAEFGRDVKGWRKVRQRALHGWITCADGRLYHPVVAEKALAAWERRGEFAAAKANKTARQQRWRERLRTMTAALRDRGITPPTGASLETLEKMLVDAGVDESGASTRRLRRLVREGEGEGDSSEAKASGAAAPPDPAKIIFDSGLALLVTDDRSERSARSLLGKWRKDHGDAAVIEAIGAAQRAGVTDAAEWIEGRWRKDRGRDSDGWSIGGTRMSSPC